MRPQPATTNAGAALALFGVLGLVLPLHTAQAGNDRIFTDGFEPCCQVGGTVSGLTGGGLVLHYDGNAMGENLPVFGNGPYNFAISVDSGTNYVVGVDTQPNGQTCSIANATGTMGSTDVDNVDVTCAATSDLLWDQGQWGDNWQ